MENENITLTLSVNDANLVLQALQELPYRVSNKLIENIQAQGSQQIQPQTQTASDEDSQE